MGDQALQLASTEGEMTINTITVINTSKEDHLNKVDLQDQEGWVQEDLHLEDLQEWDPHQENISKVLVVHQVWDLEALEGHLHLVVLWVHHLDRAHPQDSSTSCQVR